MFLRTALICVALAPAPFLAVRSAQSPPPSPVQDDPKAEFEKRMKDAEGNVEKLWKVHEWCEAQGLDKEGRSVLRAILKLDDSQKKAHELLGELEFDGKWFPNEKKLDEYKKKKLEEQAKKEGKVVYKGEIVDPADVPLLERGMKKLDGKWVSAEEFKRRSEGWVQQDLDWVPPTEAENIKKNLFKCGDNWLTEAEANTFHSALDKWWRIPSDHFVVYSTCTREITKKAIGEAERAYREFSRAVGRAPEGKVAILVLNTTEQYNQFASTHQSELRGFSSLHGATIAEVWPAPFQDQVAMTSGAMCSWDTTNKDKSSFAPFYVRHAAGLALVEALDPSPKTLQAMIAGKAIGNVEKEWYEEKQFPAWFRYGTATYVERYITDQFVAASGDGYWMKKWALSNIANKGGVDKIDDIFALNLSINTPDDVTRSQKLINESGLLISFAIEGKCAPVIEKHGALKDALKRNKDAKEIKAAFKAFEDVLRKNEAELRKYAGM